VHPRARPLREHVKCSVKHGNSTRRAARRWAIAGAKPAAGSGRFETNVTAAERSSIGIKTLISLYPFSVPDQLSSDRVQQRSKYASTIFADNANPDRGPEQRRLSPVLRCRMITRGHPLSVPPLGDPHLEIDQTHACLRANARYCPRSLTTN